MTVYKFISDNIDKTTKTYDENIQDGIGIPLIPLPYPFTTPCAEGMFQEMYYWDTYFTHKCLFLTKRGGQVCNNMKNFAYLLEKFGKILNGNRMHYISRSQPPFFGLMLADLQANDRAEFDMEKAFSWLEKEYSFWMTSRKAENGLNIYSCDKVDREKYGDEWYFGEEQVPFYAERTGIVLESTEENNRSVIAECESGWDFSPRFHSQAVRHNPVDLNSLLYADEILLADWAQTLGLAEKAAFYKQAATARKEKMQTLMKKDGVYYDYNFVDNKLSDVVSCAAFYPYFVGLDDDRTGYLKALAVLERQYGVVACRWDTGNFQWSEPNSWAPLNYIAVAAAERLGLKTEAKRLADKYLAVTEKIYQKTERLWEKYNAETGDLDVASEYGTPEMLGWTAGVYMAFYHYRESGYNDLI